MAECPSCRFPVGAREKYCGQCGAQLDAARSDNLVGAILADRYRIQNVVGEGSQGTVYRCEHVRMGKIMAIKVLRPELSRSPELVQRFKREARAVSQLGNPHTVTIFDFGVHGESIYIVTEYLRGVDLGTLLQEVGRVSFPRAVNMVVQACESLAEAHQLELFHLDLKPENLFLSRTREGEDYIKVLDYGLATLSGLGGLEEMSQAGCLASSPHYLSPEQIRGEELDGRSDVYSLGAVLYRAVTGVPPYTDHTALGVLQQHLDAPVPDPCAVGGVSLHDEVRRVLQRALAKDPEERYPGMDAFRSDLLAAVDRIKADGPIVLSPLPSTAAEPAAAAESPRAPGDEGPAPIGAAVPDSPSDGMSVEPERSGGAGMRPRRPTPRPALGWDTRHEDEVPGELLGTREDVKRFEAQAMVRGGLLRWGLLALVALAVMAGLVVWLAFRSG